MLNPIVAPVRTDLGLGGFGDAEEVAVDRALLAALLHVGLHELFRILLEDGVDLVEEFVQLTFEVRGVDAVPDRPVLDSLGPWAVVALRLFAHPFHILRPLL